MAVTDGELLKLHPKLPTREELARASFTVRYDRETDTLIVYWAPSDRPAISVQLGAHGFLRVDPETEEAIGVQIEEFLSEGIYESPELVPILSVLPGIKPREIERIVSKIGPERREQLVAQSVVGHLVSPRMQLAG